MATGAVETVRRAGQRDEVRPVARVGMAAHGLLYAVIGVLAIGVALGWGGDITDQKGAMGTIAEQPFGEVMLLLLALGLFCYAAWRFVQAVADRDDKGDDAKGRVKRAANAGKGLIAAGLGIAALRVVFASGDGGNAGGGQGGATDPNNATSGVLGWPGGQVWVLVAAAVIAAVAGWNVYRGVARKFMKRLHVSGRAKKAVERIGMVGFTARGVVLGLVAVFLAKAAIEYDPSEAVGLDGALARVVQQDYGRVLLALIAVGLVSFAVYCVAEARYRDA